MRSYFQDQIPEFVCGCLYVILCDHGGHDRCGIGTGTDDILDVTAVYTADRHARYVDGLSYLVDRTESATLLRLGVRVGPEEGTDPDVVRTALGSRDGLLDVVDG